MNEKKRCSKCGVEKELYEYYKTTRNDSGLRENCILCIKEYNKNQNLKRKNKDYVKKHKYYYDENFFENIDSEEKAYFLGFIFADGCIINNKEKFIYQTTLKLHNKDRHILETFITYLKGEMSVWENKQRDMVEVNLFGKKMINDLINLGLTQNKTFILKYPKLKKDMERHFLRGYFDGDGCIRINTDKRDGTKRGDLRIVGGSVEMLKTINQRMSDLFGTNLNKLYGPKNKDYKFIGWAGMKDIERIYEGFYTETNLFLERKKIIFDSVIDEIKNKTKYRKK